jgi:glycosyltransferase involved in cell wall biosynthesis
MHIDKIRRDGVRFSLVLATVNRMQLLDRMLASLAAQSYTNYELILVDQNSDDRLRPLIDKWSHVIAIIHVRASLGLSRARNAGITHARGELIAFPDDDCWYPEDLLSRVSAWFDAHRGFSLLCVAACDSQGAHVAARWPRRSCMLDRNTVLRACVSFGMFLRRKALVPIGGFDETLGLGSGTQFQSGEESDLALRIIQQSGGGWFEKSMWAYHPRKDAETSSSERARAYGAGFGYLLRKHRYPLYIWLYHVLRALLGVAKAACFLRRQEARFYWNSARGRIAGYCAEQHTPLIRDAASKPAVR